MTSEDVYGISSAEAARSDYLRARGERSNWLYIMLAAAGLTAVSSIAGVLVYDWYFDSVLNGLSYSLRPVSDAFHQLGGSHARQASPPPTSLP